jgi:hypothetical protein
MIYPYWLFNLIIKKLNYKQLTPVLNALHRPWEIVWLSLTFWSRFGRCTNEKIKSWYFFEQMNSSHLVGINITFSFQRFSKVGNINLVNFSLLNVTEYAGGVGAMQVSYQRLAQSFQQFLLFFKHKSSFVNVLIVPNISTCLVWCCSISTIDSPYSYNCYRLM